MQGRQTFAHPYTAVEPLSRGRQIALNNGILVAESPAIQIQFVGQLIVEHFLSNGRLGCAKASKGASGGLIGIVSRRVA